MYTYANGLYVYTSATYDTYNLYIYIYIFANTFTHSHIYIYTHIYVCIHLYLRVGTYVASMAIREEEGDHLRAKAGVSCGFKLVHL